MSPGKAIGRVTVCVWPRGGEGCNDPSSRPNPGAGFVHSGISRHLHTSGVTFSSETQPWESVQPGVDCSWSPVSPSCHLLLY